MKRNWTLYGLIAVFSMAIVFGFGYVRSLISSSENAPLVAETATSDPTVDSATGVVFYYGEECPHCHTVLDFLEEHDVVSSVSFDVKETWHDKENSRELLANAAKCGYAPNEIGVPFLYADGECLVGAPDVIGYFSERAGLTTDESAE